MSAFEKFTGINVASGFKLQAQVPLDGRSVVDTIEDRDALITENGAYEGMKVYHIYAKRNHGRRLGSGGRRRSRRPGRTH